jgi:metal-responsive CopG/Arc/MetJ family transcriptional regulator
MQKRTLSFLEDKQVVESIDKLAQERGSDRSAIIRECIRKEIKRLNQANQTAKQNQSEGGKNI